MQSVASNVTINNQQWSLVGQLRVVEPVGVRIWQWVWLALSTLFRSKLGHFVFTDEFETVEKWRKVIKEAR